MLTYLSRAAAALGVAARLHGERVCPAAELVAALDTGVPAVVDVVQDGTRAHPAAAPMTKEEP